MANKYYYHKCLRNFENIFTRVEIVLRRFLFFILIAENSENVFTTLDILLRISQTFLFPLLRIFSKIILKFPEIISEFKYTVFRTLTRQWKIYLIQLFSTVSPQTVVNENFYENNQRKYTAKNTQKLYKPPAKPVEILRKFWEISEKYFH